MPSSTLALSLVNVKDTGNKIIESMDYTKFVLVVVIFILFLLMSWIYTTLNKENAACKKLDIMYQKQNTFISNSYLNNGRQIKRKGDYQSIEEDKDYICILRNYYIKAAYNCCCGDGYKNNFVNLCALKKCIAQGARCLDFEIYSYNNEPIVAASTANNNSIKETYNYLKLTEVFDELNASVFKGGTASKNDPMILHLRIMSENATIYDLIAKYIVSHLTTGSDNLLPLKYTIQDAEYEGKNGDELLQMPITNLYQKYIIAVHTNHKTILENSRLARFVNFKSGNNKFQLFRYNQMSASGSNNPLIINASKTGLFMVIPSINNSIVNSDYLIPLSNGCQIIAMKFQNMDNNLISYNKFFKGKGGYPYVLKPDNLKLDLEKEAPIVSGASLIRKADMGLFGN
tara:strand:- start:5870 stop:7072 length:1203 start_codon:yes stop_codon:yes gene_type:complete